MKNPDGIGGDRQFAKPRTYYAIPRRRRKPRKVLLGEPRISDAERERIAAIYVALGATPPKG